MLNNITIGQYIPGKSFLHRMDPRMKIILLIAYMVITFSVSSYFSYLLLYVFTFLVIGFSGIPVRYTLKGLKPILFLCVFTTVINLFTVKTGTLLVSWHFIQIYGDALILSGKVLLKLVLLVLSASLLTLTTTPILLTDGLEKLLKPIGVLGISSHEIAMMMTIALRFIPTLVEETDRIMKAQASRGADFDTGNIFQKIKSFLPVIIPLITGAFRRATELADAMEARCYRGGEGRTRLRQLKFQLLDLNCLLIFAIIMAGAFYISYIASF